MSAVRLELLLALERGYRFAGCGWAARDLLWEQSWQQLQLQAQ